MSADDLRARVARLEGEVAELRRQRERAVYAARVALEALAVEQKRPWPDGTVDRLLGVALSGGGDRGREGT